MPMIEAIDGHGSRWKPFEPKNFDIDSENFARPLFGILGGECWRGPLSAQCALCSPLQPIGVLEHNPGSNFAISLQERCAAGRIQTGCAKAEITSGSLFLCASSQMSAFAVAGATLQPGVHPERGGGAPGAGEGGGHGGTGGPPAGPGERQAVRPWAGAGTKGGRTSHGSQGQTLYLGVYPSATQNMLWQHEFWPLPENIYPRIWPSQVSPSYALNSTGQPAQNWVAANHVWRNGSVVPPRHIVRYPHVCSSYLLATDIKLAEHAGAEDGTGERQ